MNTINSESDNKLKIAESYYSALLAKDFNRMTNYLHENVHFIGPLAEMHGREAVVSAAKNLSQILQAIHIRSRFVANNQIMLVYDFMFSTLALKLRAAVLMEFTGQFISKIELFYDGRPFTERRDKIFKAPTSS
jgi:hypothetical protein